MGQRHEGQLADGVCTVGISYREVERSLRFPPGVQIIGLRDGFNGSIEVGVRGPGFPVVPLGEVPPRGFATAAVTVDEHGQEAARSWGFYLSGSMSPIGPAAMAEQPPAEVMTAGIDVTADRVEFAIVGHVPGKVDRVVARGVVKEAALYPVGHDGQPFRDW